MIEIPHEEIRKIIRVGNSYAITIPRAWLRYFKLDDKDEVKMISNSNIIIQPQKQNKHPKTT